MRTKAKYIDLDKVTGYPCRLKNKKHRAYIRRFVHLLNVIAPNKYELENLNLLSSIEDVETNLTALKFSNNPFK